MASATFQVPGAKLYYTVYDTDPSTPKPLLLLIPGGQGDGTMFSTAAELLGKTFKTVTYDRRGYSQSTLDGAQDYTTPGARLARDADDAASLLNHVYTTSAAAAAASITSPPYLFVFGTSSGAIVALHMLQRHPQLADHVLAHEPPLAHALGDQGAAGAAAANEAIVAAWRAGGLDAAATAFVQVYGKDIEQDGQLFRQLITDPARKKNADYMMQYEMAQYTADPVDFEALSALSDKFSVGIGDALVSTESPLLYIAEAVKKSTQARSFVMPGTHFVYYLLPEQFAASLQRFFSIP